jgi:tRNA (guanine-N7-)-methyltransferase
VGKDKLRKFAEMETFSNVFQPTFNEVFNSNYPHKGKWSENVFSNTNPIVLELGCGKGEYSVSLARKFPEKNFIGIDIKGARIWRGAKTALQDNIHNVRFIRTRIEFITSIFDFSEVDEIWVTFPDPQLKTKRTLKRLTSSRFLTYYQSILKDEGIIHLKTDNEPLYSYSKRLAEENKLNVLTATDNLYNSGLELDILGIQTHYEKMFRDKGMPIHYLKFNLQNNIKLHEPADEEE